MNKCQRYVMLKVAYNKFKRYALYMPIAGFQKIQLNAVFG